MSTLVEKFKIVCTRCSSKGIWNETQLFIGWEKSYYFLLCYTCGATEAFDESGEKIDAKEVSNDKIFKETTKK